MEDVGKGEEDMDYMSPEAFWAMAFKYKLGGHGRDFFETYLNQKYEKKKSADKRK